jgi:opacity protein-like surface antigen
MFKLSLLSCLLAGSFPVAGHAGSLPAWYIALHGGYNAYDDGNEMATPAGNASVETDSGYILGAAIGVRPVTDENNWLSGFRTELEYSFRNNPLSAVGTQTQSGDLQSHTAMGNVIYDFANPTIFTPYVGAGYGFSEFDFNGDDETVDAWQMLIGIDYASTPASKVHWGVRYRYLDTSSGPIMYNNTLSHLTNENHSFEIMSRLHF